ncbi:MAG: MFS transporter [Actinomycetota bacterium]
MTRPLRERATGLRSLLRERDVRLLLGAQFIAQCADGMAQAAFADAIVLEPGAQGTPARILAVFALTLVPYSFVAPFLGVFVDRWDRRALLVWTNVVRGALLASLPLWAAPLPGDSALYIGLLVLLGFGRLFLTTKSAALPVVLHEHELLRGNAVSGGGGMIAALLGGVIGFGGVAALAPAVVFALAGLVYGGAAMTSRRISHPMSHGAPVTESAAAAAARVARELVEGLGAVWSRRPARLALSGIFVLRAAVMLTAIAAILVIKQQYPGAGDRFGRISAGALALGVSSVGAFVGALTAPRLGRRLGSAGLILLGFAISGGGIAALGGILDLRAVLGLTALGGLGAYVAKIATDARVQKEMPDEYRGRAFALYDILYNLASVLAAALLVVFAGVTFRALLVPAGLVTLLLAALLGVAMRRAGMFEPD